MTAPPPTLIREYDISARSTAIFGRVLCTARNHHFIADGPVQNGCPGEALTPPELLLTAVAGCAVELMQVIAKENSAAVGEIQVAVHGMVDRGNQPRTDVTTFTLVRMDFTVGGTDQAGATALVDAFRRRCPIYGTIAVATARVEVNVRAV
jgi:uncharacterized OsmC-like protein